MKALEEHGMQGATTAVTLRDYFAAKAMHAMLGLMTASKRDQEALFEVPAAAYAMADLMLKERAK